MTDAPSTGGLPRRRLGRTGYELSIVSAGGFLGMVYDPGQSRGGEWGTAVVDPALREAAAAAAMRRGIELGINYFDTAPMYGRGDAERLLGVALNALSPAEREGLFISTKVGLNPAREHAYDADSVRRSLERSLGLLKRDRVSIVFVHDPLSDADMDQILGPGGAMEALEQFKAQGVVGAIGLGVRIHRFLRRAIESGRFDAILPSYDYTPIRNSAGPVFELAARHDVGVVSASAYMAGLLAGIDPDVAAAKRAAEKSVDLERARVLWRWAQARGVDLGAVAMQYQLRNPNITTALVGPRDVSEIEANVRHATTALPEGIWEELEEVMAGLGPAAPGGEAGP
jgi:D-threo-aldose 1-dehydrogenase